MRPDRVPGLDGAGECGGDGGPPGPIVLVGLSGAGKTVVGRSLARKLGWSFVDLDAEVERLAGCAVEELWTRRGEAGFRELEDLATSSSPVDSTTVVSTGGGWMARPELRDAWPSATRVWLRVDPPVAASRLARDRPTRPLLAGPDLEKALRRLLDARSDAYRLAEVEVCTDALAPRDVGEAILQAIRDRPEPAGRRPAGE